MARRMSRFIHFGMAAGNEAVGTSGLDFATWDARAARPCRRRREHRRRRAGAGHRRHPRARDQGPRPGQPVRDPGAVGDHGRVPALDGVRPDRPGDHPGRRVRTRVIAFQDALRLIAAASATSCSRADRRRRCCRWRSRRSATWAPCPSATTIRQDASRPFDRDRDGFVFGEGAGVLVVESLEHALERGATILAEIIGAALTADAFHISAPEPTGRGAAMAMTKAHARRRASRPTRSTTSSPTARRRRSTTRPRPARSSAPTATARDRVADLVAQVDGRPPARRGRRRVGARRRRRHPRRRDPADDQPTTTPDPDCDLDYVPNVKRAAQVDTAMINGFGFGGQNAVAIFRRFAGLAGPTLAFSAKRPAFERLERGAPARRARESGARPRSRTSTRTESAVATSRAGPCAIPAP